MGKPKVDREWYQSLKLPEKKAFWRDNPIGGETSIEIPGVPHFKMYSTNDDVVVKLLYWSDYEGWEKTSLQLWHYLTNSKSGEVLDIGSYSGIYSLIAAQNSENKINAYDIQKECVKRVKKNAEVNQLSNINAHNLGLSDENTHTHYHHNAEENFLTSIASLHKLKQHDKVAQVDIRIGDEVLTEHITGRVSNLKMDVEGNELRTIRGLLHMINQDRPNMLIEFLRPIYLRRVLPLLPKGYKCFKIKENIVEIKPFRKWGINLPIGKNYLFTTEPALVDQFINSQNS